MLFRFLAITSSAVAVGAAAVVQHPDDHWPPAVAGRPLQEFVSDQLQALSPVLPHYPVTPSDQHRRQLSRVSGGEARGDYIQSA